LALQLPFASVHGDSLGLLGFDPKKLCVLRNGKPELIRKLRAPSFSFDDLNNLVQRRRVSAKDSR